MISRIEQDHGRFRQIVKGTIRKDLRRFIARDDMIGQQGGRAVSIPVHDIDTPTFRYGDNSGQVGMGDADGEGQGQGGKEKAGEGEGKHLLEVSVTIEELADILGEELKLPRIIPKGKHNITTVKDRYSGVRPVGPNSLRHFKRTYREALRRQLALGDYDPDNPVIVPVKNDLRFRSWTEVKEPHSNALAVYMMDVSGSMGNEQKELVRLQAFWIDSWLRRNYKGFESRFIVHDVNAKVVDRETFFSLREDGGTKISSALVACRALLKEQFDPADWNIYLFHFSDGDNSSDTDNRLCIELLQKELLPVVNQFGYVQVKSAYGSGQFHQVLRDAFPESADASSDAAKVATAKVNEREDVLDALRALFKAGR
ncbi:MAG TPA: DUF444 family protein [Phycisphaerales bacterium]|nr:DUF444 family protein [Phycisphaerales bacterium]